jgi:beta-lactamase superfamily II metal-dependent hydrolase
LEYEIDFLAIGDKTCGDSYLLRFGNLDTGEPNDQTVVLIDGGFTDDSSKVKGILNKHYMQNYIDLVISTHPDQDHINGLPGVLDTVYVGELWMHLPWDHSVALEEWKQADYTTSQIDQLLAKSLKGASNLLEAAQRNNVTIREPFANEAQMVTPHGRITVVGPSRDYYESLLPQFFDWHPKSRQTAIYSSALQSLLGSVKQYVDETFNIELLKDDGKTSPQNSSSAIVLIEHDGKKFLFTGDAGIEAIELAAAELEFRGHAPGSYTMVQLPHHGSRQNVGPTVLTRLLGDKVSQDGARRGHAYVSSAKECDSHPKKLVMNAFRRRGYPVSSTEGTSKILHNRGSMRPGYSPAEPHPLYRRVEADS